jgi:hypothetical protein
MSCIVERVPSHEDGGERTKEILAHSVEEAEVLGKQGVDGLEDVLKIVGLHCRQLLRRRASISLCLTRTRAMC